MKRQRHDHDLACQLYSGAGNATPETQFRNAMYDARLITDVPIIADGNCHRFRNDGDKKENGWYFFHGNYGAFGDWKFDIKGTWSLHKTISKDELRLLRQQINQAKRIRAAEEKAKHKITADLSRQLWKEAEPVKSHPYLTAKGVQPHGVRQHSKYRGALLVPMRIGDKLWSLERIWSSENKKFMYQGRVNGCFYMLGEPQGRIWIAEGFATAASVREVTGDSVVCAFNAGNMPKVARWLAHQYINEELIIAADHDAKGLSHGHEAMRSGFATYLTYPPIEGYDWNDYQQAQGTERTRKELSND